MADMAEGRGRVRLRHRGSEEIWRHWRRWYEGVREAWFRISMIWRMTWRGQWNDH